MQPQPWLLGAREPIWPDRPGMKEPKWDRAVLQDLYDRLGTMRRVHEMTGCPMGTLANLVVCRKPCREKHRRHEPA